MRFRREHKAVSRFGEFAAPQQVEEALDIESASEIDEEEVPIAGGRSLKVAGHGSGRARGAQAAPRIDAAAVSTLLASAPPLVDLLLQQDPVRSITLCCRDVVNLSIAFGGGVDLRPVWSALAQQIKCGGARHRFGPSKPQLPALCRRCRNSEAAAAAAKPEARAAGGTDASINGAGQAAAPEQQPAPQPSPAARTRRGCAAKRGRAQREPPPPGPLDVIRAAVAADPAREAQVKRSEAMARFQLTAKDMQGIPTSKGKWGAQYMAELDARIAAHRKWGDQALLEAGKARADARRAELKEAAVKRRAEARAAREEELVLRLLEAGLPADTADDRASGAYWELRSYLDSGYLWMSLTDILAPIIQAHQRKVAKEKREARLNERLEAEGLTVFKLDWRYHNFINNGSLGDGGLEHVLEHARQYHEAELAREGRVLELADRLHAAGLPWSLSETYHFSLWLASSSGGIAELVAGARARADREAELQELLAQNGLLHQQLHSLCRQWVAGELPPGSSARGVVQHIHRDLKGRHARTHQLLDRLLEERLPPSLDFYYCDLYIKNGGSLESCVERVRREVYGQAGAKVPPPGKPWLAEGNSDSPGTSVNRGGREAAACELAVGRAAAPHPCRSW